MATKAKTRPKARPVPKTKPQTTQALVPQEPAQTPLAIIERVARDKTVDVTKLAALVDLQKDMMRVQAKIDFDQALQEARGGGRGEQRARQHPHRNEEKIHDGVEALGRAEHPRDAEAEGRQADRGERQDRDGRNVAVEAGI